jgi:hypothetical protein
MLCTHRRSRKLQDKDEGSRWDITVAECIPHLLKSPNLCHEDSFHLRQVLEVTTPWLIAMIDEHSPTSDLHVLERTVIGDPSQISALHIHQSTVQSFQGPAAQYVNQVCGIRRPTCVELDDSGYISSQLRRQSTALSHHHLQTIYIIYIYYQNGRCNPRYAHTSR